MREEFGDARVIRRYANRRFYDAKQSRAVTLEEIAEFVRKGEDVRVLDAESGEEITRRILTQIILEDPQQEGLSLLPVELLRKIISMRDEALTGWLQQYLAVGAEWLERQVAGTVGLPGAQAMKTQIDAFFPWMAGFGEMPKPGAAFGDAPRQTPPPRKPPAAAKPEPDAEVGDEIAELQRRLAELAAKVKRR